MLNQPQTTKGIIFYYLYHTSLSKIPLYIYFSVYDALNCPEVLLQDTEDDKKYTNWGHVKN